MDNHAAIWEEAERALIVGDINGLEQLLREHKRLFREELPPTRSGGLRPDYSGGDVREILLKNHQLEDWDNFSKNEPFEAAVDAVVSGDERRLVKLVRDDPELVRARSLRRHRATLLHYVGANGVEYFRQTTPSNVVQVTEMLLQAGAETDAEASIYGGSTALVAPQLKMERAFVPLR